MFKTNKYKMNIIEIKGGTITVESHPYRGWTRVEVSHYSELESTDIKGYENKNCIGGILKRYDIAMPKEIPLYTQVILRDRNGNYIKDKNGNVIKFTNMDRGHKNVVKIYQNSNKAAMRIDRYMKGLSVREVNKLGLKYYDMLIVRWGKGSDTD